MKEKDKNKIRNAEDLLRYSNDNLSNTERNAFERELQKDPFSGEAAEGLSSVSAEEARSDLNELGKRLISRTARPARYIIYRIAASVAVLMVISSVYFLVVWTNPTQKDKIAGPGAGLSTIEKSPAEKPKEPGEEQPVQAPVPSPSKAVAESKPEPDVKSRETAGKNDISDDADKAMTRDEVQKAVKNETDVKAAVKELTIAEAGVVKMDSSKNLTGEAEISLMARDQAAAAGTGEKKARSVMAVPAGMAEGKTGAEYSRGITPQPVNGMESYNRYIEENIRIPSGHTGTDTVTVNFVVRINGNPERIKIIESPGRNYSEEAIRLVKEGPRWNPATENGVIKEKEVNIKIVFK
jgi:hypothetical protein